MKIVTFLLRNDDLPKLVVDFLRERDTFRKHHEIVKDFVEKSYNNNRKPWKSFRILRVMGAQNLFWPRLLHDFM